MVPLLLTLSRVALTPFIVYFIFKGWWLTSTIFFLIAAVTDILDGALARYLQQETELGAYLDPIADKFLIIACYGALLYFHSSLLILVPLWFVGFVFIKELIQVVTAIILKALGVLTFIKPSIWGKSTTVVQSCLIIFLCLSQYSNINLVILGLINSMLVVALCLNIITIIDYGLRAYKGWKPWDVSR